MKESAVLEIELAMTKALEEKEDSPELKKLDDVELVSRTMKAVVEYVYCMREINRRADRQNVSWAEKAG